MREHVDPERAQVLRDLEPDVTPADDGRPLRGMLFHMLHHPVRVGEKTELEDAVELRAGDRWKHGPRAGRDDQPVVGVFEVSPVPRLRTESFLAGASMFSTL